MTTVLRYRCFQLVHICVCVCVHSVCVCLHSSWPSEQQVLPQGGRSESCSRDVQGVFRGGGGGGVGVGVGVFVRVCLRH